MSPPEDPTYEDTLELWKKKTAKLAFVYEYIIDKYKRRVDLLTLTAFLLTSITSLLALSNLGLPDTVFPEVIITLKILNAVLTTFAAIVTGIPRLFGWPSLISACQKYLDTVEYFTAAILSEQVLPDKFRKDPEEFILRHKDQFLAILGNAPDISYHDYQWATNNYHESNFRFRQNLLALV